MNNLNQTTRFFMIVWALLLSFSTTVQGQVSYLQGKWIITTDVSGAEFSSAEIDSQGNAVFTQTLTAEMENKTYIFDIQHTGKVTYSTSRDFVYTGTGSGTARDTNGTVKVQIQVVATGMGDNTNNMVMGLWTDKEQYITPQGTLNDEEECTFTMVKEGYDPGTPGQAVAGIWQITLTGENISWTGQVTMNPNGTLAGEYSSSTGMPPVPLAGFYTYDPNTKAITFNYTTMATLPVIGELQVTVSGTGKANPDLTQIAGTWSITVVVKGRSYNFKGTYEMKKLPNTPIQDWSLF